ncbi:MAG: hypothetical protein ACLFT0_12480, partial [Spirulinaceae cyanobacterium]
LLSLILISCAEAQSPNHNATDFPAPDTTLEAETIPEPENVNYERYYNSRFDYSVIYPVDLLEIQEAPTNNDGRRFVAPDNRVEMVVYGSHNSLERDLDELYQEYLGREDANTEITYRDRGDNWFVVSGYDNNGDEVFYNKVVLQDGVIITLELRYDAALQSQFDPIVADISRSLQVSN